MNYKIGVLNGDDIGPEIMPVAVRVLQAAISCKSDIEVNWVELPIGYTAFLTCGETLPADTLETLSELDGWILGPIGHAAYPKDEPTAGNPHPILRRHFDLISNIRPALSHPSVPALRQDVDLVIVRENNEGFQPDRNMYLGYAEFMPTPDMALSMRVISRKNSNFVARTAFDLARRRGRKKRVTAVHKNTVFQMGCGLFVDTCRDVATEYPDIQFDSVAVDTFAMYLLMRPADYDVVVTTNLFGDILSDEAAGLVGGLGMAPGLCEGPDYLMAQATHGSAPDLAGKNVANPYAMIMSGQMLLSRLAQRNNDTALAAAAEITSLVVAEVLSEHDLVTPDIGGSASTEEFGDAVCERIASSSR